MENKDENATDNQKKELNKGDRDKKTEIQIEII